MIDPTTMDLCAEADWGPVEVDGQPVHPMYRTDISMAGRRARGMRIAIRDG